MSAPAHTECSAVFDQNQHDPCPPPSLVTQSHLEQLFLFPRMKKVLKEKRLLMWKQVKQKTTEALKGIKIDKFKNCFKQWGKGLARRIASNGEHFAGD